MNQPKCQASSKRILRKGPLARKTWRRRKPNTQKINYAERIIALVKEIDAGEIRSAIPGSDNRQLLALTYVSLLRHTSERRFDSTRKGGTQNEAKRTK